MPATRGVGRFGGWNNPAVGTPLTERLSEIGWLADLGERMVAALRARPAANDFDGWVAQLGVSSRRARAKAYLMAHGPSSLPALRRGFSHPKAIVRRQCVNLLNHIVDTESLPYLVAAGGDEDPSVAARALHSLACDRCKENDCRPGEDQWAPRAFELLHDPNPDLRAATIDALGKVAQRRPMVAAALGRVAEHDKDQGLRGMALRYMATTIV
jgi:hypothetical protein